MWNLNAAFVVNLNKVLKYIGLMKSNACLRLIFGSVANMLRVEAGIFRASYINMTSPGHPQLCDSPYDVVMFVMFESETKQPVTCTSKNKTACLRIDRFNV